MSESKPKPYNWKPDSFAQIPCAVLQDTGITSASKIVLAYLISNQSMQKAGPTFLMEHGRAKIAQRVGLVETTVTRSLGELARAGYITFAAELHPSGLRTVTLAEKCRGAPLVAAPWCILRANAEGRLIRSLVLANGKLSPLARLALVESHSFCKMLGSGPAPTDPAAIALAKREAEIEASNRRIYPHMAPKAVKLGHDWRSLENWGAAVGIKRRQTMRSAEYELEQKGWLRVKPTFHSTSTRTPLMGGRAQAVTRPALPSPKPRDADGKRPTFTVGRSARPQPPPRPRKKPVEQPHEGVSETRTTPPLESARGGAHDPHTNGISLSGSLHREPLSGGIPQMSGEPSAQLTNDELAKLTNDELAVRSLVGHDYWNREGSTQWRSLPGIWQRAWLDAARREPDPSERQLGLLALHYKHGIEGAERPSALA